MAERNLPIKFFEKRKNDELLNEGRGGGNPPKFVLKDKELIAQSSYVKQFLGNIGNNIRTKLRKENHIPTVFRVKVKEKAIAKSHRGEIGKLFNTRGKINIIGVLGDDELLVKVDNVQDLDVIEKNVISYDKNKVGLSAIDALDTFEPLVSLKDEKHIAKVKLINYQDYELNKVSVNAFERYCTEKEIKIEKLDYTPELHLYQIVMDEAYVLDEIKGFDGVYSIVDMPIVDSSTDAIEDYSEIDIKEPLDGVKYPIVGVLDSGISENKFTRPWIVGTADIPYIEDDINKSHGTFVTGVLLQGDELEGQEYTGTHGCKVLEAIVIPDLRKNTILEGELIHNIKKAIRENSHIKIWNLSLGSSKEADFDEFSDFAKALDKLQDDYNVLIVKSSGNCDRFITGGPKGRITRAADSVRSLVVGSIAHAKNDIDLADVNYPSPFTRIGPGPAKTIKPDLVHYGGNVGLNGRFPIFNGVKSFDVDGKIVSNSGTSFSTPRVTAIAAGLMESLKEEFNPLLIKALLIHSAEFPTELKMSISEKIKQIGFGKPSRIDEIIYNDENEITLILQDTLERGSYIHILDFPFPQSMNENDFYYGDITVTLVNAPILDENQGAEYCQSDIDVKFGTYDAKKERDLNLKGVKNPLGYEGGKNLLHHGCYSTRVMNAAENPFSNDRLLINYEDKWQSNKKYVIRLSEMTEGNAEKYLKCPKLWFMKIESSFRNNIEERGKSDGIDPSHEFCMIITIRDNKRKHRVYDEVTQYLNQHQFLHKNIQINEHVRIENRN